MLFPETETIRCLGMHQPFASLMLHGKFETRWVAAMKSPPFPLGKYLLYTTDSGYDKKAMLHISGEYQMVRMAQALSGEPTFKLSRHAICIGDLVEVRRMTTDDENNCFVKFKLYDYRDTKDGFKRKYFLWCLIFKNVKRIEPFFFQYGKQGIGIIGQGKIPASVKHQIKETNIFISHLDQFERHQEVIECPSCFHQQQAEVIHSVPFATYIHHCVKCKYIIMESEWSKIEQPQI
jgi:hypothetical protein